MQTTLFDPKLGEQEREAAIEQVTGAAERRWMDAAYAAIEEIAKTKDFLTTDDIWELLFQRDIPEPHEKRAMAAIVRHAVKDRLITGTPEYRPSKRPDCHRRPIKRWRSLVH